MCALRARRQKFLLCVGGLGPFAAPRAYYLLLWVAVRGPTPRIAGSLLCRPLTSLGVRFLVFVSGVWGFGLFPASAEFFPVLAPGRFVALGHRILFPCKPVGCRCGGMGFPRVHNNPEQGLGVIFCVCSVCCICPPRCCPFPSSVGSGTPALFRICVLLNFGISAVFVARRPLAGPFAGIHAPMTAD